MEWNNFATQSANALSSVLSIESQQRMTHPEATYAVWLHIISNKLEASATKYPEACHKKWSHDLNEGRKHIGEAQMPLAQHLTLKQMQAPAMG